MPKKEKIPKNLKKLHAAGAKLTLPSPKTGHTPIHVAARYGNTPLDMAEAGGHTELVQYLLAKGGKRNRQLPPIKKQDPPDADSNYTCIRYIGITLLPLLILLLIWQRLRSKKDNSQQSGESEGQNL